MPDQSACGVSRALRRLIFWLKFMFEEVGAVSLLKQILALASTEIDSLDNGSS